MSYGLAVLYGFLQGVAEFLPISSSGHLALLPFIGHFDDPGFFFDLSLHLGTSIAVILYFRNDLIRLFYGLRNKFLKKVDDEYGNFAINLIVASIATFIVVLLIKRLALDFGRSSVLIAFNLIFFAIIMAVADRIKVKTTSLSWRSSIIIGISQALAIFPGVSRSGITITASRFLGMDREGASRFSFLLSLPIIIGGFVFELPSVIGTYQHFDINYFVVGIISSFLFGIVTIHFFLKVIKKIGLIYFSLYRIILGFIIIALVYLS